MDLEKQLKLKNPSWFLLVAMKTLFEIIKIWTRFIIYIITSELLYIAPTFISAYILKKKIAVCDNCGIVHPPLIKNTKMCKACSQNETIGKVVETTLNEVYKIF